MGNEDRKLEKIWLALINVTHPCVDVVIEGATCFECGRGHSG